MPIPPRAHHKETIGKANSHTGRQSPAIDRCQCFHPVPSLPQCLVAAPPHTHTCNDATWAVCGAAGTTSCPGYSCTWSMALLLSHYNWPTPAYYRSIRLHFSLKRWQEWNIWWRLRPGQMRMWAVQTRQGEPVRSCWYNLTPGCWCCGPARVQA